MNCIGPLAPEDFELLAYADGDASPEMAAHVSSCGECQGRVKTLQREELVWQTALHRAGCPSGMELGEHVMGMLPPDRAAGVAEHLEYCRACAREVTELSAFLARVGDSRLAEDVAQAGGALRRITARLTGAGGDSGDGPFRFQPMALRDLGGAYIGDSPPLTFDAEEFLVTLEVFPEPGAVTRQVIGLVAGPDDFAGAQVELTGREWDPRVAHIDELGSFILTGIAPGLHHLLVTLPTSGAQVQIDELTVH